jgi:uncharacterized membrane-anchored protein
MDFLRKTMLAPCHWIIAVLLFVALCPSVRAQDDKNAEELRAIYAEMAAAKQIGPADIALGDQGTLKLPQNFVYVPQAPAKRLMKALGNRVADNFYGLVVGPDMTGFVCIEYNASGHIKEDDAKTWDANELLDSLKAGTEEGNKERREQGIGEIEVVGWVEKPAYDQLTHRLIWSAASKEKGTAAPEQGVNYNTYVLGREGFFSLNLVTSKSVVEKEKPQAQNILAATTFNPGRRYEDFDSTTDRISEYGLTALIAGVAAKKLGLLAVFGVFLLKAWKLILVGAVAIGAIAKKFVKGRKTTE